MEVDDLTGGRVPLDERFAVVVERGCPLGRYGRQVPDLPTLVRTETDRG